jgi:hypothetical protein
MIDTNMNVYFTGMVADNAKTHKSILTGFIRYDKTGKEINLYASFDVYTSITKVRGTVVYPYGSPETDGLDPDTESAPEPLK